MDTIIKGAVLAPLYIVLLLLGLAWETIWVDQIWQLVAARYNTWPVISYTEWFAINCVVSTLCRGPKPKETDTSWVYYIGMFVAPVAAYITLVITMWWVR